MYRSSVWRARLAAVPLHTHALRAGRLVCALTAHNSRRAQEGDGPTRPAAAVLGRRRPAGGGFDLADPDSVSAGSFFMNPARGPGGVGAARPRAVSARRCACRASSPTVRSRPRRPGPSSWAGFTRGHGRSGTTVISTRIRRADEPRGGDDRGPGRAARRSAVREAFGIDPPELVFGGGGLVIPPRDRAPATSVPPLAEPLDVAAVAERRSPRRPISSAPSSASSARPRTATCKRRIERAADPLREADKPVTETVLKVGFTWSPGSPPRSTRSWGRRPRRTATATRRAAAQDPGLLDAHVDPREQPRSARTTARIGVATTTRRCSP